MRLKVIAMGGKPSLKKSVSLVRSREPLKFKYYVLVDTVEHECMRNIILPKTSSSESRDLFKLWEIKED